MHRARHRMAAAAAAALILPLAAVPAAAQGGDGYLLRRPVVTLAFHGGYHRAQAASDIFEFARRELTLERRDFDAAVVGGQIAARVGERVDVALTLSTIRSSAPSEFRDWVDQNDLPIQQATTFRRTPLTLDVKFFLRERGRSVGHFAWVPRSWSPYVGAGAGFVWYTFEQEGDFVDFETLEIFTDRFYSDGRAPTAHLFAGVQHTLSPTFLLTVEGRYAWAHADLERDFLQFDPIDVSGLQATVGLAARF